MNKETKEDIIIWSIVISVVYLIFVGLSFLPSNTSCDDECLIENPKITLKQRFTFGFMFYRECKKICYPREVSECDDDGICYLIDKKVYLNESLYNMYEGEK